MNIYKPLHIIPNDSIAWDSTLQQESLYLRTDVDHNTVFLQMNGAGSKVSKKFISKLKRAKRTSSAAATVQVSHALPAVRSLVFTAGPVSKMASQQEKAFCVLRFEVSISVRLF